MYITKHFRILAALLTVGAAMAACSGDDIDDEQPQGQTPEKYTITVKATKDMDATRGLELSGSTLSSLWEVGEKVVVVQDNASSQPTVIGELAATEAGLSTTLTGTVNSAFNPGKALKFYLHSTTFDYTAQDGTLETVGQNQTFASCEKPARDIGVNGSAVTISGDLGFSNAQAVVLFNLVDKATESPINAKYLTVHDASGKLVLKADQLLPSASGLLKADVAFVLASAGSTAFVSLSGVNASNLTIYASDGRSLYGYTKQGVTFQQGKYYQVQVKMTKLCSIGDVILSDGSFAAPGTPGAVAMVAYLGNDAGNLTYNRGLAIALKDASSDKVAWSDNFEELAGVSHSSEFSDHLGFLNGIADTETLSAKYGGYAASKAKNFAVAPPSGTSGWFLASSGQWMKFFEAAGVDISGATKVWYDSDKYYYIGFPGGTDNWTKLCTLLEAAASGSSLVDDCMYWSSSEYTERYAIAFCLGTRSSVQFWYFKKDLTNDFYVRSFLAF